MKAKCILAFMVVVGKSSSHYTEPSGKLCIAVSLEMNVTEMKTSKPEDSWLRRVYGNLPDYDFFAFIHFSTKYNRRSDMIVQKILIRNSCCKDELRKEKGKKYNIYWIAGNFSHAYSELPVLEAYGCQRENDTDVENKPKNETICPAYVEGFIMNEVSPPKCVKENLDDTINNNTPSVNPTEISDSGSSEKAPNDDDSNANSIEFSEGSDDHQDPDEDYDLDYAL